MANTICTMHGLARMNSRGGNCPRCADASSPPKVYENIVMVSTTMPKGTKRIDAVISEHFVGYQAGLEARKLELRAIHKPTRNS